MPSSSFAFRYWKLEDKYGKKVEFPIFDESSKVMKSHQRYHHVCDELLAQQHRVLLRVRGKNVAVSLHQKDEKGKVSSVMVRNKSHPFSTYKEQTQLWKVLNDSSASVAAAVSSGALARQDTPILFERFNTLQEAGVTQHAATPLLTTTYDDAAAMDINAQMQHRAPLPDPASARAPWNVEVETIEVWVPEHNVQIREKCYKCMRACRYHVHVCRELASMWDARTIEAAMMESVVMFNISTFQESSLPDAAALLYHAQTTADSQSEESSDDDDDDESDRPMDMGVTNHRKIVKQYCAKLRATTDKEAASIALGDYTSWWGFAQVRQAHEDLTSMKRRQRLMSLVSSVFYGDEKLICLRCIVSDDHDEAEMHKRPLRVHQRQADSDSMVPIELPLFQSPFDSLQWLVNRATERKESLGCLDPDEEHAASFDERLAKIREIEQMLGAGVDRAGDRPCCYVLYRQAKSHERPGMYQRKYPCDDASCSALALQQVEEPLTNMQRALSELQVVAYHQSLPAPAAPPAHLQPYLPPFSAGHKSTKMQRYRRAGYVPEHVLGMSGALLQQLLRYTQHKLTTTTEESAIIAPLEARIQMRLQEHCRREHMVVQQDGTRTTTRTIVEERSRQMTVAPLLAEARKTSHTLQRRQQWLDYLQRAMNRMTSALEEYQRSTIRQLTVVQSIHYADSDEEEDWYTALPPTLKEKLLQEMRLDAPVEHVQPDPNLDAALMARVEHDILRPHQPNSSFLADYAHFHQANEDVQAAQEKLRHALHEMEEGRKLLLTSMD